MQKRLQKFIAAALLCTSMASMAADVLPVTASFSILADLVRVVGGDRVRVSSLVGPDQDAHVFEPKPADARTLLQSRLLVTNGLGFDPWAQKLAQSAGYRGATVVASQGVKGRTLAGENGHPEADPHAWQDPGNVVLYVRNIATALGQLDPAGAAVYQAHSQAYEQELKALDSWAQAQFAAIPAAKRRVITSHDAFGYFAAHYQLNFRAPQGISTEAEPSAKEVAQLIRQMKREKTRAVFMENMGNPKLLAQISQDTGATPGASLYADALSAPDQPGATYLQMLRHNVTALVQGMQQN